MMLLILRPRGRVPASNSFFSRRVGGPGISFECAFQIDTDTALVSEETFSQRHQILKTKQTKKRLYYNQN